MTSVVVDTNVLLVANNRASQAGPECVRACVSALQRVTRNQKVCLDTGQRILREYISQRLAFSGQPDAGDAFFKWLFDNQANPTHCELVEIHPRGDVDDNFTEFPEDPALTGFDRSDRKFVAVALASTSRPRVLNAVDSDWWHYREKLARHHVLIDFLCPEQFSESIE